MRASRLVSLLLLLQARGRMTAVSLAAELGVSVRTVYRDVEALQHAGVPVYGEAGPDGGYRLVGGYRTQLTGLTPTEAAALWLMALPAAARDLGLGDAASAASVKVRAALRGDARRGAETIAQRVHVDPDGWYADPAGTPLLAAVADAVWRRQRLWVRYRRWRAPDEVERALDPYGLVLKGGRWYVVAGGTGRVGTYRVAHLLGVRLTGEQFERPDDFDLAEHWRAYLADFDGRRHRDHARVRLSPAGRERLTHLMEPAVARAAAATVGEPDGDGWVCATIPIESVGHAHEQLLRLGAEIEVLSPHALRERLAETAAALARRYRVPWVHATVDGPAHPAPVARE